MRLSVTPSPFAPIAPLRDLFRAEANCQIIHDSHPQRGIADLYLLHVNNQPAGYAAIANKYDPNRIIEFHTFPSFRHLAVPLFETLRCAAPSPITHVKAQTNIPQMLLLLYEITTNVQAENYLFADNFETHFPSPKGRFRSATPKEKEAGIEDNYLIDHDGQILATGGFLTHYNPPYADVYFHVNQSHRQRGIGAYFVQQIKQEIYQAGKIPAARCNADNLPSKKTIEKAGMKAVARLLVGQIKPTSC